MLSIRIMSEQSNGTEAEIEPTNPVRYMMYLVLAICAIATSTVRR